MKKTFLVALMVGFFVSILGCGGGGGGSSDDGSSNDGTTPSTEPAYRIEHQGDVFQVPSYVDGQMMRVIVKNKTNLMVDGMTVRVVYAEFSADELEDRIRIQELVTDEEGLCLFEIPRYDGEGERLVTISLPRASEIEEVVMTIRYVIDEALPTRVMINDDNQAEISLELNEDVKVLFVVLNAWGDPVSNVETEIIVGEEYTDNYYCVTDDHGLAAFHFTAGETSGSTVFRIQVIDYPAVMAEVIISWTDDSPVYIEMLNPSRWEGDTPVMQAYVGNSVDITFFVDGNNKGPAVGVMIMVAYPASASDVTDVDGIATITIPASQFAGWDADKVWVVGKDDIYLDFKIEYLNP